ncbi:MAG TPA: ABC transporter substrate-binding protein, partial [Acetobacteraceae bacterium]
GVKFSDGSPLRAEDVKWSLDRARNPKNGAWNDLIASIDAVEIAGPATVVLKLKRPDPTLLPALATFNTGIMPERLFEATPGASMEEKAKAFAEKPIGTGPFVLADWKRGQRMLLARNPHHWKRDESGQQLPYLDELEFQIIPDDATRLLKLKAGEIHGAEFVPYSRVKELQADPNLRMELWPSTRVAYLGMMVKPKLTDGSANPLSNQKVRQALNYAVNKDAVIAITTQGLGKPMRSYMSSTTPLFDGSGGPLYPYNPAKAKALLAEAGFPNGFEVSCMMQAGNQDSLNNLTTVQQMWAQVGVRLKIEQMDSPTLTKRYRAEDYQMRTGAWTNDIADPGQITSYFAYSPNINSLHSGWENAHVNELYLAAQQENDVEKRRAEYKEIQAIYNDAATIVSLYETPYPVVFRKNVRGFVQIPLGNNYFDAAYIEK